jgi:hypothetical protein
LKWIYQGESFTQATWSVRQKSTRVGKGEEGEINFFHLLGRQDDVAKQKICILLQGREREIKSTQRRKLSHVPNLQSTFHTGTYSKQFISHSSLYPLLNHPQSKYSRLCVILCRAHPRHIYVFEFEIHFFRKNLQQGIVSTCYDEHFFVVVPAHLRLINKSVCGIAVNVVDENPRGTLEICRQLWN